ncbi:MAG: hypothetical protein EHM70_15915 [Chloroflexota bacterium]|nr:MAG: hypothetical protein EHM70_15915 [Chloroflexota bacterium]
MNGFRWISGLFLVIGMLFAVQSAAAHRPSFGDQQELTEIENIDISNAFYRQLGSPSQVDAYVFDAQAGERLHAGINIPALTGLEEYQVSVALFGPGLPEAGHDVLPEVHPEDLGALVFSPAVSEDFFEPFTQTRYWGRQQIDMDLPETGTYYLLVWSSEGKSGKYVLDVGEAEVFGPADLLRFPVWWLQARLYFGQGPVLALAGMLLLITAVAVITLRGGFTRLGKPRSQNEI